MFLLILHIYFVSFLDKPEKSAPQLSPRAVAQRAQWGIQTDGMDYPVSASYQNKLRKMGVKIHHVSRWFNGVTCEMDSATAASVAKESYVTGVEMTREENKGPSKISKQKRALLGGSRFSRLTGERSGTEEQLAAYNLTPLHEAGFEGQGILMAVCDGAFSNANTLSCFRQKALDLGSFDFTDDSYSFYGYTGAHGTECLSAISGILPDFQGAATQAQYYLMRAEEQDTESPKEMDNLVAALEKADSLGVNVFSVSLGYYLFDNDAWNLDKATDLDGQTTRCSRAATIAARKGMLVCVSAGNEGNKPWRTICAPADADSILTVGAVATDSTAGVFTSYGPSSDGRVKPEVCAVGVQTSLIYPDNTVVSNNGTSFATPLIAGLAASLWSALPTENAMQIRERIIRSAHLYPSSDANNRLGYGIPNAWTAYTMSLPTDISSQKSAIRSQKILRNGEIVIQRNGREYTLIGIQKR